MKDFQKLTNDYKRLEFLGDRVLNLIVSRYLFIKFPYDSAGQLTDKLKFTSNNNLEEIIDNLPQEFKTQLFKFISGFRPDGQASNADALEAFIGNYFLENEFENTIKYFEKILTDQIDRFDPDTDYISKLKIYSDHENEKLQPKYKLEHTEKGQNNQNVFYFQVFIGGVLTGSGSGSSHAEAKKQAALDALKNYNLIS